MKKEKFLQASELDKRITETSDQRKKMTRLCQDMAEQQPCSLVTLIIQYNKAGKIETTHCNVRKEVLHQVLLAEIDLVGTDITRMEKEFSAI